MRVLGIPAAGRPFGWKFVARQAVAPTLAIGLISIFWQRFQSLDAAQVAATFAMITPAEWVIAAGFTAISFAALGAYDRFWHGYFATGIKPAHAWRSGMASVAVAQTTGMGLIVGTFMRWRLQPGIGLARAGQITLVVALSFLVSLGVLLALVLSIASLPGFGWAQPLAVAALAMLAGLIGLGIAAPSAAISGWIARVLPLRGFAVLFALATIDSLAAAGALIVLIPGDAALPLTVLVPAFLVALAMGYLSGMPCGLGAIDVTLLMLLPMHAEAPLVAALVGFRLLYFGVTAILGGIWAVLGAAQGDASVGKTPPATYDPVGAAPFLGHPLEDWLHKAQRAEAGLLRQGHLGLIRSTSGQGALIAAELAQCTMVLGDPIGPEPAADPLIQRLCAQARARQRGPVIYKCGAATARAAQRAGLKVWPLCREAWIDPQVFTTEGPARSGLRRKLRRSQKAGFTARAATDRLPIGDMHRVADDWAAEKGGERGFSTGRFHPDYVARQQVWLGYQDDALVAWISFHENQGELTLDLMRQTRAAADGAMHALIVAAVLQAKADRRHRLSLAAIPEPGGWLRQRMNRICATDGLTRFKTGFDPLFEPLYMAAPGWITFVLAAFDIRRAILPTAMPARDMNEIHYLYDQHEIASSIRFGHKPSTLPGANAPDMDRAE